MKNYLFLLSGLMALIGSVYARAGTRGAVRITSRVCGTQQRLVSSGVPVRYRGISYVLTSSWGILEEGNGICHTVYDPQTDRSYRAELSRLEWTRGFALLIVPELPAEVSLDEKIAPAPSAKTAEIIAPERQGLTAKAGRYISTHSDRHYFIDLPHAYELVSTAHVDRRFIGAPVYGNELEGIISAEWIETIPGKRGRIREWTGAGEEKHNRLVLIPLREIWQSLESGPVRHRFFEPAESKLGARNILFAGKLRWELHCPPHAGEPPPDGIGPIGGSDGVGIGGESDGTEGCSLEVGPAPASLDTPELGEPGFLARLEKEVAEKGALRTDFFYRNILRGFPVRHFFLGWQNYFHDLKRKAGLPVFFLVKMPAPAGTSLYDKLRREVQSLVHILQTTYPQIAGEPADRHMFRTMYTVSAVLESLQWRVFSHSDMLQFTSAAHGFLGKKVIWEGRPLLEVLREKCQTIEKIRTEMGYDR